jgi:hypothetical protein
MSFDLVSITESQVRHGKEDNNRKTPLGFLDNQTEASSSSLKAVKSHHIRSLPPSEFLPQYRSSFAPHETSSSPTSNPIHEPSSPLSGTFSRTRSRKTDPNTISTRRPSTLRLSEQTESLDISFHDDNQRGGLSNNEVMASEHERQAKGRKRKLDEEAAVEQAQKM